MGIICILNFVPSAISALDARGLAQKISISLNKVSPAVAAIEDIRASFIEKAEPVIETKPIIKLFAGRESFSPPKEKPLLFLPKPQLTAAVVLPKNVVAPIKQTVWPKLRGLRITAPQAVATQRPEPKTISDLDLYDNSGNLLPMSERKRRLGDYYARYDLRSPSWVDKAKEVLQNAPAPEKQDKKTIETSRGAEIYIAKVSSPQKKFAAAPSDEEPHSRKPTPRPIEPPAPIAPDPGWAPAVLEQERQRPLTLLGNLEMTGGLAFTGTDTYLTVGRYDGGLLKETGKVWVQEARFEIPIQEIKGYLVAELRSSRGEVLGRGELDLFDLPTPRPHEIRVNNIMLRLKPVSSGMDIRVLSADSYSKYRIPVSEAELTVKDLDVHFEKQEDIYSSREFLPGSSAILQARAQNYWGSLAVGLWEGQQQVLLYTENKIKALLNLTLDSEESARAESYAIVWGRVAENGNPISGASVELAGDSQAYPIYFNEAFLPDKNLQETSSNGMFAFVMVSPGIHSLRARVPGGLIPAIVLPAEAHMVSYADLEFGAYRTASLHVFDAIDSQKNLLATVSVLGTDSELDLTGIGAIQYASGHGQMVLEADAGPEYEISRTLVSRLTRDIQIPLIRRDWLSELAARKKINLQGGRGIAVGVVLDEEFEVFLSDRRGDGVGEIVYFSPNGEVSFKQSGEAGGGFAVFNLPMGFNTISIAPKGRGQIFTQVLVAEPDVVNVLYQKLSD